LRRFAPVAQWSRYLDQHRFRDTGARILQAHDPSANTLMSFVRGE